MQLTDLFLTFIRALVFGAGLALILWTLISAIKTFVLPRGVNVWLTRVVFRATGSFFRWRARRAVSYEERDRIMALFAPLTLVLIPLVVLSLIMLGYIGLYWALDMRPLYEAFRLSGSSLLTLGYASVDSPIFKILEFSEAMLGLILVAMLIAYLPSMYSAFARRETAVALLESWAGSPPSAQEILSRTHRIGQFESLDELWSLWSVWFAEVEESHTSLAPLAFFRSPQPMRSWITAAGAVLDGASLYLAVVDRPFNARAAICIRTGYLALRNVAEFFGFPYDPQPSPDAPVSISRNEFDAVYDDLEANGLPLKPDRDQAWRDFAGWRVNYDAVLLQLAAFTMAPYAPWSSDRVGDSGFRAIGRSFPEEMMSSWMRAILRFLLLSPLFSACIRADSPTPTAVPTPEPAPESTPTPAPTPAEAAYPVSTPTAAAAAYPATADMSPGLSSIPRYTFTIVHTYEHDPTAFTQGLILEDGFFYEGTGLYSESTLRRVDVETGAVLRRIDLPEGYFGEGITAFDDRIIQLTWREQTGFVYDWPVLNCCIHSVIPRRLGHHA